MDFNCKNKKMQYMLSKYDATCKLRFPIIKQIEIKYAYFLL